jgi:hypothetical protein
MFRVEDSAAGRSPLEERVARLAIRLIRIKGKSEA